MMMTRRDKGDGTSYRAAAVGSPSQGRFASWEHVMNRVAICLSVWLGLALPVFAAFDYSGQERTVAAYAGIFSGFYNSDIVTTNDLGEWSETSAASLSNESGSATAAADQTSNLSELEMSMTGNLSATSTLGFTGAGQSLLNVSFFIDSDTPYVSELESDADIVTFSFQRNFSSDTFEANSNGVLPAGNYTLSVVFQAGTSELGGTAAAEYRYRLVIVPEPFSAGLSALGGACMVVGIRLRRGRRCWVAVETASTQFCCHGARSQSL
jgi:hypothetical protein